MKKGNEEKRAKPFSKSKKKYEKSTLSKYSQLKRIVGFPPPPSP